MHARCPKSDVKVFYLGVALKNPVPGNVGFGVEKDAVHVEEDGFKHEKSIC
jgi:hypothetical protein